VARKRVRRQLIASVKAREAVIREHLRQRKREREARAAIVLQALWRGHRVYQAEKQRRAAEKKAESEVAAWEAAKQLELDQYKAAVSATSPNYRRGLIWCWVWRPALTYGAHCLG